MNPNSADAAPTLMLGLATLLPFIAVYLRGALTELGKMTAQALLARRRTNISRVRSEAMPGGIVVRRTVIRYRARDSVRVTQCVCWVESTDHRSRQASRSNVLGI